QSRAGHQCYWRGKRSTRGSSQFFDGLWDSSVEAHGHHSKIGNIYLIDMSNSYVNVWSRGTLDHMAHVILGLLMLWPQSLYEPTKHFTAGISLFYSASTGSIKRALDRLIEDEYIAVASEHGPRGKKTYEVTPTGR